MAKKASAPVEEPEQPVRDELREHRVERFQELRFTNKESEALADAKDADGFPLYWGRVKKALDSGCSHKAAVNIFT